MATRRRAVGVRARQAGPPRASRRRQDPPPPAADERARHSGRPRQGRGPLPRRAARRAGARGRRRGPGDRLRLERRVAGRSRARPARRCSRSTRGEFGHGRTRNLGAERASGDVIAFLTQDATPAPGWLDALREGVRARRRRRRRLRPAPPAPRHQPDDRARADRVLRHVRADDAPPRVFGAGDPTFLSNVNAAYRRACWEEIRFDDVAYSEDQAFGRALAAHPRWRKAYHPRRRGPARARLPAAGVHAPLLRRVPRPARDDRPRRAARRCARRCAASAARWRPTGGTCASAASTAPSARAGPRARWSTTAAARRSPSLGLARRRAARRRAARAVARAPATAAPAAVAALPPMRPTPPRHRVRRRRARAARRPGAAARRRTRAWPTASGCTSRSSIPTFNVGSGGHYIIFQLVQRLERMGHTCSIWVHDLFGTGARRTARRCCAASITESFAPRARRRCSREFDALVRRRRGGRHRLADRLPGARARRLPRPRLPGQRPRARVLRHVGRARVGGARRTASACTASPAARGCATCT